MNDESHSAEATHPTAFTPPAAAGEPRRGRPSSFAPVKLDAICTFIRLTGMPDTAAAAMAGIPRATLSRWKDEFEEVEIGLERARAQYIVPRLDKIAQTRMKDGQLDWRARLIKYASPELHGPPSRRRRLQDVELSPEEERRAASPPVARENVTNRSELPEPCAWENVTDRSETPPAAWAGGGVPPLDAAHENVANRPETPAPEHEILEGAIGDNVAIRPETPETNLPATPPDGPREWRPGVPRPTRRERRRQHRTERKAARAQA